MDIFDLILLCGGLAFFLYGMQVLSDGLERTAGSKMQSILQKITGNRVKGLAVGATVTAVIQSSSAVTVMLVGLVNSGIMTLRQAISVIMGSNIGTTMTAWILSLSGIESDVIWMQLLKPKNFALVIALIGAFLLMLSKKEKGRNIGTICIGFAVLMYGMEMMSSAVKPLAEMEGFTRILTMFQNPILGVIVGALFTAAIQSSSASVGVLQALANTGAITYSSAIPIIMGQNIGTCISAMMATPGTSKNAKRVAVTHVLFNSIGSVIWLAVWSMANAVFDFAFADQVVNPMHIAVIHSIFNIATTVLLLPAAGLLEKLSHLIVHGEDKNALPEVSLDQRLLTVPSVAFGKAYDTAADMATIARETVSGAVALFQNYNEEDAEAITYKEKTLDLYEDKLGTYLVTLSRCELSVAESRTTAMLLHAISDFERIGDHANNIMQTAAEMAEKKIAFSEEAVAELRVLTDAVQDILGMSVTAFRENKVTLAQEIEPLEQVIDQLIDTIRARHITRLQSGNCTIELGFVLTDFLTDCERISDHCSNIGVAIMETAHGTFDVHARLGNIKKQPPENFIHSFESYAKKYDL